MNAVRRLPSSMRAGPRQDSERGPSVAALNEVRSALAAGAGPAAALGTLPAAGPLAPVVRAVRLGRPLAEAAADLDTGDPAADLLVRALAVAERTGAGAVAAVDQAVAAVRDEAALARQLRVGTAQARGSAVVLTAVPAVVWLLLVALDPSAVRFYATPLGLVTGLPALALAAAGHWWSRRLTGAAGAAAAAADPLVPARPGVDLGRAVALALPALVVVGVGVGPAAGALAAAALVAVGARRGRDRRAVAAARRGGAAETVELVAVALAAGLPTTAALSAVAPLGPPAARPALGAAVRRLRGGWDVAEALAGTGLETLGATLGAAERWGAPAEAALRRLADDLRAERRAAAQEAAERLQLLLVFPTTLLTLPAFVLGVVPPMLWSALAR
ncbi:MAG TPA: type II secretion system F family protein [Egibacteraceae bacterium]|nr:type II secretion system F family protein [Egibacteraceae bacterium]